MAEKKHKSWKDKRFYETGAYLDPSSWFYLEHPTHSDWYSLATVLDFIDSAERANINPLWYVALGISESGLGNKDANQVRIFFKHHPSLMAELEKIPDSQEARQKKAILDYGAKYLAQMLSKYSPDVVKGLQAYSGTGRTIYSGHPEVVEYVTGSRRSFGKPFHKIRYDREMPQAVRILEIASKLRQMPELAGLLYRPTVEEFLGRY